MNTAMERKTRGISTCGKPKVVAKQLSNLDLGLKADYSQIMKD
jgi:hypothetical protein